MSVLAPSVAEQVATLIREAIIKGELEAGERYSVEQIAKLLNLRRPSSTGAPSVQLSRTPVREALVRLSEAGMVRVVPNRGYEVLKTDVHDVEELFQLRLMLEVPAAYRAAQRADETVIEQLRLELGAMERIASQAGDKLDPDVEFLEPDIRFHELVLEAAGNRRLVLVVRQLRYNISTLGAVKLSASREGGLSDLLDEHKPVLASLEDRDPEAAAQAMYDHVMNTGNALM